jgi:hypothetical protein
MDAPPDISEKLRLIQIEDSAIKTLLETFEHKAQLVSERLRETADRTRLEQVNKSHVALQKKRAKLARRQLALHGHSRVQNESAMSRDLDRILQIQRNIKHDMILLDALLDDILGRSDKL